MDWHWPATQNGALVGHTSLHAPQLLESLMTSIHSALQQAAPELHAFPQEPQSRSVESFTEHKCRL